jgi:hypothetical protein
MERYPVKQMGNISASSSAVIHPQFLGQVNKGRRYQLAGPTARFCWTRRPEDLWEPSEAYSKLELSALSPLPKKIYLGNYIVRNQLT